MPEYLTPGVYIEEIGRGPRPIEGVPTSTAAFVGETERGHLCPRLVTSYNEYERWFGSVFKDGRYMPDAVSGFFENGGKRLYVCRIVGEAATTASKSFGDFKVSAVGPGAWGRNVWTRIQQSSTKDKYGEPIGFRLKLAYWAILPQGFEPYDPFEPKNKALPAQPQWSEDYDDLSVDPELVGLFPEEAHRQLDKPVGVRPRGDRANDSGKPASSVQHRERRASRPGWQRRSKPPSVRTISMASRPVHASSCKVCGLWSSIDSARSHLYMRRGLRTTRSTSSGRSSNIASACDSALR